MSLSPYPTYMDSGPSWSEQTPSHWEQRRAKWLFRKHDRPVRECDEVITCFRDGMVTLRRKRRTRGFTEALKEIGYQGIRRGDLVIHAMDAFAGAIGVSDSDGKGSPVYAVCQPGPQVNAHYYAYLLREMARSEWILALAKGIRERSTDFRYADFASQLLPVPPLAEQAAIVRYLDYVDRRIRRAIRAKTRLIALLEEQKQAIIHRAVTRGLNPDVPLKPSGVKWLGDVPAHWELRRLRHLATKFGSGFTPRGGAAVYQSSGVLFLRSQNVHFGELRL
jgi:type I restriction enzyme S subunit